MGRHPGQRRPPRAGASAAGAGRVGCGWSRRCLAQATGSALHVRKMFQLTLPPSPRAAAAEGSPGGAGRAAAVRRPGRRCAARGPGAAGAHAGRALLPRAEVSTRQTGDRSAGPEGQRALFWSKALLCESCRRRSRSQPMPTIPSPPAPREDEVFRPHPLKLGAQLGDDAILDACLHFHALGAQVGCWHLALRARPGPRSVPPPAAWVVASSS